MSFSVQMPALGESVTEGTVTRWLKQEGDRVEVDEPLLEVSTDKVDTEIPSPAAGVLQRIIAGEDETVEVGGELAVIGDEGEDDGSGDGGGSSSAVEAPAEEEAEAEEGQAEKPSGQENKAAEPTAQDEQEQQDEERQEQEQPEQPPRAEAKPVLVRFRHHGHRCRSWARASPRARSRGGSSRSGTPSRSTSRCSRSPPTRSTPRSPRRSPARCWRSSRARTRRSRSAASWP